MKASAKRNSVDRDDARTASDSTEPVVELVDLNHTIDLTAADVSAPMRHFHRAVKARSLSSGPLANPLRTRLS